MWSPSDRVQTCCGRIMLRAAYHSLLTDYWLKLLKLQKFCLRTNKFVNFVWPYIKLPLLIRSMNNCNIPVFHRNTILIDSSAQSIFWVCLIKIISINFNVVSDYARLRKKRIEMEKKERESKAFFVKELVAKSPSLSRGQIMVKIARRKSGNILE